ncbi:MAG: C25 family cysteine peptidase [Bacteroidota bacterium]|nr:C25 family cysteine peptidase [Bacteroidota bacterium]
MKKTVILFLFVNLLLQINYSYAQNYGNEWYVPSQTYFKMSITQNGVYRLDFNYLSSQGFPVLSSDPKYFQIWRRGQELAIKLEGEADGVFNQGDYIEFYATKNDGILEAEVYNKPENQTHPYYSLYSDTAAYFITIGASVGKRMQTLNSNFTSEALFHFQKEQIIKAVNYSDARDPNGFGGSTSPKHSWGISGEGWVGADFTNTASETNTFTISNVYGNGSNVQMEAVVVGRNPVFHNLSIQVTGSNNQTQTLTDYNYTLYDKINITHTFSGNSLIIGSNSVSFTFKDATGVSALSSVTMFYPQSLDMLGLNSKIFDFTKNASSDYANITNYPSSYSVYDISDVWAQKIVSAEEVSNKLKIAINKGLVVVNNQANTLTPLALSRVYFRNIRKDADFIIVSHKKLFAPVSGSTNPVLDYAQYRASINGGSHDTLVIDINELYNHFTFGETNYLAIRKLCKYLLSSNLSKQKYLFLLGQGISVNYVYADIWARINPAILNNSNNPFNNYVPTLGYPSSDILYAQGLGNSTYANPISIARYAARNGTDIISYLNKVKEYESVPSDLLWRKNMLFLSGGRTTGQIIQFKEYIQALANYAQGPFMGAKTTLLSKSTPGNTEFVDVSKEVNEGLSMIYSIGHTSQTYFDVNIGFVSDPVFNYSNKLKYPFLYVNGCSSGNIFFSNSLGQDWITAANKGAIAFLAHTDVGADQVMNQYSNTFFQIAFGDTAFLGKSIATIQSEANNRFMQTNYNSEVYIAQTQQFVLQGDPSIKLFNPKLTDYYTYDPLITLQSANGQRITAQSDSFLIKFQVLNYGKYSNDSLKVKVTRTLADGTQINYTPQSFPPVARDTFYFFKVKKSNTSTIGYNRFDLCLNYDKSTPESNYNNNCGTLIYQMPQNGVVCLFPPEYGIVNQTLVNFIAQSTNFLEPSRSYLYEIDTSYLFNSAVKISGEISSNALISFSENVFKNFTLVDSTVFFWRVRYKDLKANEENIWGESSFIYIKNSTEGWSQAIFPQFSKSTLNGVERDTISRKWNFPQTNIKLTVNTSGALVQGTCGLTSVQFDSYVVYNQNFCAQNFRFGCDGFIAIPISQYTLAPYTNFNISNPNNSLVCRNGHTILASYGNPNNFNEAAFLQIINDMPDGDYLLLVSSQNSLIQNWPSSWINGVKNFGANQILSLTNDAPFIFLGQKGGNAIYEIIPNASSTTPSNQQSIQLINTLKNNGTKGDINSTTIGPAEEWGNMERKFVMPDGQGIDKWKISVFGRSLDNTESILYSNTSPPQVDLKSIINASSYPYLRLQASLVDSINKTPAQLKKWQVNYEGVPEGTLYFDSKYVDTTTYSITPKENGEKFTLKFAFKNISPRPFKDSLTAQITLRNSTSNKEKIFKQKLKPLKADSVVVFTQEFDTKGFTGDNFIQVFVNPRLIPELSYNNNLYNLAPFKVNNDNKNPILDVTFDGQRILNGDIVSPDVVIAVALKDESKFNYKTDTSGFSMLLRSPCGSDNCTFERIPLNSSEVKYTPATQQNNNSFRVEYQPKNLADGNYTLRVNGTDATGNISGVKPYEITFEVVNAVSVTNFFPYPNPFSTRCKFIFTLTGREVPDQIMIRIMTISGKIVREISADELGPLRIGNNISDFTWDGTDEYGDKLANGVYLYKVIVKKNGQDIDHRTTAADAAFSHGFGKMYILR